MHGVALNTRDARNTTLLITSRNHHEFKRFTLAGHYLETIHLPGSFVCRQGISGNQVYEAVFRSDSTTNVNSGHITILDQENKVTSAPGGSILVYKEKLLPPQQQGASVFKHPHDVCVDNEGNLYVCQWKAGSTYPIKLERL